MSVVLWYVLLLLYGLQAYFAYTYFSLLLRPERKPKGRLPAISIIICAKNEGRNLSRNLPFILEQKYPEFEVIIMDDHSTDNTRAVCSEFEISYDNLRLLSASEAIRNKPGKKWALAEAIEKARNRHLLLTDADCRPGSLLWIEEMASRFTGRHGIVLGIGQYTPGGKWFDGLIQYETLITAMTYLSMAKGGYAYMGIGRNLAYQKRLFNRESMTSNLLASGDDDLFIQGISAHGNTTICTDERAQTFSESPSTYKEWLRQKTRHYSTGRYYRKDVKIRLLLLKTSFYLPNYLILILLFVNYYPGLILFLFSCRWLLWLNLLGKIKKSLAFRQAVFLLPCYEIYFSVFDLWTTLKSNRRNTEWT